MHVVWWNACKTSAPHDLGGWETWRQPAGGNLLGQLGGMMRPVSLQTAYLAAIMRQLGHSFEYAVGELPATGKVYFFQPTLLSLARQRQAMRDVLAKRPQAKILVCGALAAAWPELFIGPQVQVIKGEPEQLLWRLKEVLDCGARIINLGSVDDLDTLPWPDWSGFAFEAFRMPLEFGSRRVGMIHLARGEGTSSGGAGPGAAQRCRAPQRVVSELRHAVLSCDFEALHFCDGGFPRDPGCLFRLAEMLAQLPIRLPFSIQLGPELLPGDTLRLLRRAGLTCVRLALDADSAAANREGLASFVATCSSLSIRTIAELNLSGLVDAQGLVAARGVLHRINATSITVGVTPAYLQERLLPQLYARWKSERNPGLAESAAESRAVQKQIQAAHKQFTCSARLIVAGYRRRVRYWREQAAVRWPAIKMLAVWRHAEAPPTDVPHLQTPKPLGGIPGSSSLANLRKDSPHKRSSLRRNHDR